MSLSDSAFLLVPSLTRCSLWGWLPLVATPVDSTILRRSGQNRRAANWAWLVESIESIEFFGWPALTHHRLEVETLVAFVLAVLRSQAAAMEERSHHDFGGWKAY